MNGVYALLLSGTILTIGCGTARDYRQADLSTDQAYKKRKSAELKESEVLGLKQAEVSDADIARLLDEKQQIAIKPHASILLVQSGAGHPDREMVALAQQHFTVLPYTGVPSDLRAEGNGDVSKALRLAAANAKAETIVVYWGCLEMKRDDLPTGLVSWVPVVDFVVPDEHQKVRLSLKVAVIDVRTGHWATFRTEPIEEQTLTTRWAREKAPHWPLGPMKTRAYEPAVRRLVDGYVVAKH